MQHVVYTSGLNPEPPNPALIKPSHWATEQALAESGLAWTVLATVCTRVQAAEAAQAIAAGELAHNRGDGRIAYVSSADAPPSPRPSSPQQDTKGGLRRHRARCSPRATSRCSMASSATASSPTSRLDDEAFVARLTGAVARTTTSPLRSAARRLPRAGRSARATWTRNRSSTPSRRSGLARSLRSVLEAASPARRMTGQRPEGGGRGEEGERGGSVGSSASPEWSRGGSGRASAPAHRVGMSVRELARRIDVSASFVSRSGPAAARRRSARCARSRPSSGSRPTTFSETGRRGLLCGDGTRHIRHLDDVPQDRRGERRSRGRGLVEELGYSVFWLGGSPRLPSVRPLLEQYGETRGRERASSTSGRTNRRSLPRSMRRSQGDLTRSSIVGVGVGHPGGDGRLLEAVLGDARVSGRPRQRRAPVAATSPGALAALAPKMLALSAEHWLRRAAVLRLASPTRAVARASDRSRRAACARGRRSWSTTTASVRGVPAREYAGLYLGLRNYTGQPAHAGLQRGGHRRLAAARTGLIDAVVPHGSARCARERPPCASRRGCRPRGRAGHRRAGDPAQGVDGVGRSPDRVAGGRDG